MRNMSSDSLSQLLSSRVRSCIFRLLFGLVDQELHLRELARQSGLAEAGFRQEMRKLLRTELVIERRSGNRVYYRANRSHPLFSEIHGLVLKTVGLVEVLAGRLGGADIQVAFVFGSVAQSKETAQSDVDLMVIGAVGLRGLTNLLVGASEEIGREINPHVMTAGEYSKRVKSGDHFAVHVLAGPKLFVSGTQNDLESMGK